MKSLLFTVAKGTPNGVRIKFQHLNLPMYKMLHHLAPAFLSSFLSCLSHKFLPTPLHARTHTHLSLPLPLHPHTDSSDAFQVVISRPLSGMNEHSVYTVLTPFIHLLITHTSVMCQSHPFSGRLSSLLLLCFCNTSGHACVHACQLLSGVRLCAASLTVAFQALLCPWNSPGKNTGVGCRFLL